MIRNKITKIILYLALIFMLPFTIFNLEVKAEEQKETSMFDGVLQLVSQKGGSIVKSNLPKVGDFLCSKVFDYIGIDYTDSYTKELKAINEKLDSIEADLKTIIQNQEKGVSQTTMQSFFNAVDTFSTTVHPLYAGYNALMRSEKDGKISSDKASLEEEKIYNSLKEIVFGSASSTGSLYLQLTTLLNKVCEPNQTVNKTLMQHYVILLF